VAGGGCGASGARRGARVDPDPAEPVRAQQACLLSGLGAATDHAGGPGAHSGPALEDRGGSGGGQRRGGLGPVGSPHRDGLVSPHHPGLARLCPPRRPAGSGPAGAGKRGAGKRGGGKGGRVEQEVRLSVAELRRTAPNCAACCPPCATRRNAGSNGCGGRAFVEGIRRAHNAAMSSIAPSKRPASSRRPPPRPAAAARAEVAGVDVGTVETDLPAAAAVPAGASSERSPTDAGRDPLGHTHWWLLARLARPVWFVVHGSRMLSPLAPCGNLGTDPASPLDPRCPLLFLGMILKWHCSIRNCLQTPGDGVGWDISKAFLGAKSPISGAQALHLHVHPPLRRVCKQ
jgi:hypothetical protein